MPTNLVFKNRESEFPNRRKLTIVEQQGNEMLVEIERADGNVKEEGTPINAAVLNQWTNTIDESERKSTDALNIVNQANENSENALNKATIAETNSVSANESSASALKQVNALVKEVDISQINGTGTPSVSLISNSDGTKKLSFKNLKGVKGDTGEAAGFGTIDATATALPVGGTPYAEIAIDGPDTEKNIHFDFGLPAGIQGERGEKGDKGDQGNVGSAAGFGQITAAATTVGPGGTPYVNVDTDGSDTAKNIHFDFGLLSGVQGERGEKGDSIFIRFSFDKTTMTEMQTDNSMYIGFYNGKTPSTNPKDYQWIQMWGAKSISASAYSKLLTSDTVNPEQIYFVEGVDGDELHLSQYANDVSFDDSKSRLSATNVQDAIDKLKAREFSKSYNELTNKPFIPTNDSFTLAGLSEKSYQSLTDKPVIPTNRSFTLAGLSERSYESLTDKPVIPTNSAFTLAGLAEKSYNSLTDKPYIPQINRETIAGALGIDEYHFEKLIRLAEVVEFADDGGITFNTYSINVQ